MFFKNKKEKKIKCENCGAKSEEKFSFCPFCGNGFVDHLKEKEDYGLLGRKDEENFFPSENLGFTDKIFSSLINSMMKSLDKQFQNQFKQMNSPEKTEIKTFPNGVKIKISGPYFERPKKQIKLKKEISPEKLKKMGSMPREKAKANVKRFDDKIVYELSTPGVASINDIFISKLESGYEVKAIGDKTVYVNSIPLNLPLKSDSIIDNKLSVEFLSREEFI